MIFKKNNLEAIQTAVFIRKEYLKCLSGIYSCFQTSRGLVTKTKMKAKEKLPVEKKASDI